ncbi:MAG: hypothetical protein M1457_09870 [bacterium]|nr:hypothetical protein [bacterium]
MRSFGKSTTALVLLLAALAIGSCIPDRVSWSPDGRHVAFIHPGDFHLWLWDTRNEKPRSLVTQKIYLCRFAADGRLFYSPDVGGKGEIHALQSADWSATAAPADTRLADDITGFYDLSPDGRYLYYAAKNDGRYDFYEINLATDGRRRLLTDATEPIYLRISPDRTRLAYSTGDSLRLFDLDAGTTRSLVTGMDTQDGRGISWPIWIASRRLAYNLLTQKPDLNKASAELIEYDLDGATTKTLCRGLTGLEPASLSPDGRRLLLGIVDENQTYPVTQLATLEIASGAVRFLTAEPFGAGGGRWDPAGRRIAFDTPLTLDETMPSLVRILDPETHRTTILWTNEPERLFATADAQAQAGKTSQAVKSFDGLLKRYPEAPVSDFAVYERTRLALEKGLIKVSEVSAALDRVHNPELREMARKRLQTMP